MKFSILSGFEFLFLFLSFSAVLGATELKVRSERTLPSRKFEDRTEGYVVSRASVMQARSRQLILPVSVIVQNLDTTIQSLNAELLDFRFLKGSTSLGRFGFVEELHLTDTYQLLVKTGNTLSLYDLTGTEEVWRIPLPKHEGAIPGFCVSPGGAIYLSDLRKKNIRKMDRFTGEALKIITADAPAGTPNGLLAVLSEGKLVVAGGNRFSVIDEEGKILQQLGKVFPHKMYPSVVVDSDGSLLLSEYVSMTHPNDTLKRKTWLTVLNTDGTERWDRLGLIHVVGTGSSVVYVEERSTNTAELLALDKRSGSIVWRYAVPSDNNYSMNVKEAEGIAFVGSKDAVFAFNAATGALIATKRWEERTHMTVQGAYANEILVTNRLQKAPHTYSVFTLRLE